MVDASPESRERQIQSDLTRGEVIGLSDQYNVAPKFDTQRVIIRAFLDNDPSVVGRFRDAPVSKEVELPRFSDLLRNGGINPDHANLGQYNKFAFLENVPSQVDNESDRNFLSNQLAGEMRHSRAFSDEAILFRIMFGDHIQLANFDSRVLSNFLSENPTPEMLNDKIARTISTDFQEYPARQAELLRSADQLLTRLYGRRQEVYTQFRLLVKNAFPENVDLSDMPQFEDPNVAEDAEEENKPSTLRGLRDRVGQSLSGAKETYLSVNALMEQNQALQEAVRLAEKATKDADKRAREAEARADELYRRLSELDQKQQDAAPTPDRALDPRGYYALVGLTPGIFKDMPEEAIQAIIKGLRRGQNLAKHDDKGVGGDNIAKINAALDALENSSTRY